MNIFFALKGSKLFILICLLLGLHVIQMVNLFTFRFSVVLFDNQGIYLQASQHVLSFKSSSLIHYADRTTELMLLTTTEAAVDVVATLQ